MKKIINRILGGLLVISFFGVGLSACGLLQGGSSSGSIISSSTTNNELSEQEKIYELAVNSGYTGTYEEWLNSIKGKSVELSVQEGVICWRHQGDNDWKVLISVSSLKGEDGLNGKEIELNVSPTHIQWRYVGESTFKDLISLNTLRGKDGTNGSNGTDGEDGKDGLSAYEIAVKLGFEGDELAWLESLRGQNGQNGTDGREVEFNVTPTHVQWRYVGEETYKDLISLDTLRGKDGTNGSNGTDGVDGIDGLSAYEIAVKLGFEGDELAWLESLRGQDGNNGLSAYEIYLKYHPEYKGSEEEWINDLANGNIFSRENYVVTFDYNNDQDKVEVSVLDGKKVSEPEIPVRPGFTFDGWYYDDLKWVFKGYSVTENMTLTAKWIPNTYRLTFHVKDMKYYETYNYDEIIDFNSIQSSLPIDSWSCNGIEFESSQINAKDLDVSYASYYMYDQNTYYYYFDFEGLVSKFKISFEDSIYSDIELEYGDIYALPVITDEEFKGWYCIELDKYINQEDVYNYNHNITVAAHYYEYYWTNTDYYNQDVNLEVASDGTIIDFTNLSYNEKTEILGKLEKYAMENNLTGLVLYDDGSYVKYADRVVIPTAVKKDSQGNDVERVGTKQHEYVVDYGFGIVSEGTLDGSLGNANIQNPTYYHTFETSDPGTLNYMNDYGSAVASYHGYVSGSYFSKRLDAAKTGYEWYPQLASEANLDGNGLYRPTPLNTNAATGLATKYRIYVRTGADLKYNTLSTNAKVFGFAGREVALDDYLTPFKELHNQKNGMARGAENLSGAAAIKGMAEYYAATATGYNEAAWNNVGIKTGRDYKGSYLDFEFVTPTTPFYAMYYLSSSLYAPIPAEFLTAVGGINAYQSFGADGTGLTPVDTTLSTGPYCVESWTSDASFTFKKNELMSNEANGGANRYQIPGLHIDILRAALFDSLAAWKEYKAGNLDSFDIPLDVLQEALGEKGTQTTKGSSTTKLNVNTCTPEEWEYLFGENGTVTQTPKAGYWQVEPAMSNEDFLMGLNLSIDRQEYAEKRGVVPSCSYFSDAYMSNPEAGVSYNSTEAHKNALEAVYGDDVDTYGYNLNAAAEAFANAAAKLIADGVYKAGDTIEIEMAWQTETNIENTGKDIEAYITEAWELADTGLNLKIVHWTGAQWSDVYYKKMMVGQFDIGFGGISGDTLNPLGSMEFLKSDNSSGFTLSWGPNTNDPAALIEHNGNQYTYDALCQATQKPTLVSSDGGNYDCFDAVLLSNIKNSDDNSRSVVIKYAATNIDDVCTVKVTDIILFWIPNQYNYEQTYITDYEINEVDNTITFTIPSELAEKYQGKGGIEIYYSSPELGDGSVSLNHELPKYVLKNG